LSAETLVGHALGLRRMQLYVQFERLLSEAELEKIRPLVRRRAAREPLQYILGETEFCGLTLKCDRRALIPRPETEYLVELLLQRFSPTGSAQVLDLGTGTGALALGLARLWPTVDVTAIDVSADALALARENTEKAGLGERVRLLASDWFSALEPGRHLRPDCVQSPVSHDAGSGGDAARSPGVRAGARPRFRVRMGSMPCG
jgi:release factor glutamine methyltransferase